MKKSKEIILIGVTAILLAACSPNCGNKKQEYLQGYQGGKLVKLMGTSGTCSEYVNSFKNQSGRSLYEASDCFCDGYNDGLNNKTSKY